MKRLLFISFLLPVAVFSQEKVVIKEFIKVKDPEKSSWGKTKFAAVVLSNQDTVAELDKLKLGKGSLPNGDYNYIATSSNTMESKLKGTTQLKEIELKFIMRKGNEKYGYVYVFQAEGPRGGYLIQLEDAIVAGEIVLKHSPNEQ